MVSRAAAGRPRRRLAAALASSGKSVRGQPVRVQRFAGAAEGRVAFDVNLQRAEQSGLRVSSQLLKRARIVGVAR
jgi:hypothetical protein